MIEQQIRPWEVLDQRVLDLVAATPREQFVPEQYRNLAFADVNLPLGEGEVMMQPKAEARLLQALQVRPEDVVLEVGTGSGYVTACLAKLARHVYSVEIRPEFSSAAAARLDALGISNVSLETGDAAQGWDRHAPYDVIAVTGSLPLPPSAFEQQLAPGGRLFVIVGEAPAMEACLITRVGDTDWTRDGLFETVLPPLRNAPERPKFVF